MTALAAGFVLLLAAGAMSVVLARRPALGDVVFGALFAAGAALVAVPALGVLAGAPAREVRLVAAVPGGPWSFGVDALSAAFLVAIAVVGTACALFGAAYLREQRPRRAVGRAHLCLALLVAALVGVVTARAAVPFLIAWETMAVTAYLLVVFEHDRAEIRRAGLLYLVATHAGTLALFGMFAAWGDGARDLGWAALAARVPALPNGGAVVLALAFVGFGLKAGIAPLHFWLPEAHAAAPSHVSALMSGIVIKMGIYGLLRVVALLGSPPAWSGWLLLALGASSGVLGVVWALAQHDVKRLLAFHSVENIGIILLGMGAGVLGGAYGLGAVAVLGFAGAALHTVNHALFKSLLFLGAGSMAHGTGTRAIDRMGGLARRMPLTAVAFLIGSAAIVGLPPLNGFVSEWLVFRALAASGAAGAAGRAAVLGAPVLGLIGALALACFAKVVGVIFLGSARDPAAAGAREAQPGLVRPLYALALACAAIGLVPALAVPPALRVGAVVAGVPGTGGAAGHAAPLTVFALGVAAVLAAAIWAMRGARAGGRTAVTWGCGYPLPTPRMQYTASSFAAPVLAPYAPLAGTRALGGAARFSTHADDPVLAGVLRPAWAGVQGAAVRLRPLQHSRLSGRLLYLAGVVVALLLYLVLAGAPR